jgi:hypothetical protein
MKYPIRGWAELVRRAWILLAFIILAVVIYYEVFLQGGSRVEPLRNVESSASPAASVISDNSVIGLTS